MSSTNMSRSATGTCVLFSECKVTNYFISTKLKRRNFSKKVFMEIFQEILCGFKL